MPLFNPGDEQLERRASIGRWEIVRASFTTANEDLIIRHRLPTPDPEQVAYQQLNATGPATLYHDGSATRSAWGDGFVRLRVSVAPVVMDILLQVVAAPIGTTKLPMGGATIPGINADTLDGLDSSAFARSDESYVTLTAEAGLTNETPLAAGTGIALAGATVSLDADLNDLADVNTTGVADGDVLVYEAAGTRWIPGTAGGGGDTRAITFVVDGGGSAITTGIKADVYVPYAATITAVTMLADQSGSIVVDIWKDSYANYPPTDADSITAAAVPTITTATKSQDTTLTGWTTSISAGDTLRFNVDSITTVTRLTLALTVTV